MGNSIEDYRAAIGSFHMTRKKTFNFFDCRSRSYYEILINNLRCTCLIFSLFLLQSVNPNIDIVFLFFVLHLILIIGNIETNPGPCEMKESNTPLTVNEKTISICTLNIRSIRNKLKFLDNFSDEFDILALTETHLDPNICDKDIELNSFSNKIIRKDRNNFGGGLLIYVKDDIGILRRNDLENQSDETLWVEIRAKGQTFLLCNTYRPPESNDGHYWTRLNHAIGLAYQFNENIVITGDLNSDLFKAQNNKLIEILNIFNLRNVIDKPTRVTNHSSTLLDPIILSDTLSYFISDVLPTPSNISDHDAPIIFLECPTTITRSYKREIWIYEKVLKNWTT